MRIISLPRLNMLQHPPSNGYVNCIATATRIPLSRDLPFRILRPWASGADRQPTSFFPQPDDVSAATEPQLTSAGGRALALFSSAPMRKHPRAPSIKHQQGNVMARRTRNLPLTGRSSPSPRPFCCVRAAFASGTKCPYYPFQ